MKGILVLYFLLLAVGCASNETKNQDIDIYGAISNDACQTITVSDCKSEEETMGDSISSVGEMHWLGVVLEGAISLTIMESMF